MRIRQHHLIFLGMFAGAGLGLLLTGRTGEVARYIIWLCDLVGTDIFIGALKMIVVPLIFFSILAGITSLSTKGELWSIGWRTLVFYVVTTSIAVVIGLFFVLTLRPGSRDPELRAEIRKTWDDRRAEIATEYGAKEERVEATKGKTVGETIRENLRRIIMNPFESLATMNSLGIIFFAIVLGIALIMIGSMADPVLPVIVGVNAAIMLITRWIMWGAPFFIFCLVASLVAKHGPAVFGTLGWYVVTVLVGIACHVGVLLAICRFVGGLSPWAFLKGIRRAWAVAFTTRSSAATLPVTIDCVENEVGVPRKVADFVLPIGATVNMDGTALYEGVAVIFLIQLFGGMPGVPIELTPVMTGVIFLTAVLASIGAAAVPDAGLVTMVLVAGAVGLDASYIVLVFAVDALVDMFRTSTNVMGDSVGAVVVARLSGEHAAGRQAA